jgi:hypothetical protein
MMDAQPVTEAFYSVEADGGLRPTALASGPPWLPGTQHGSMVTALMARAVEAAPAPGPMQLSRLTVELSRPVPFGSTRLETAIVRDGKRVQTLDVTLLVDGAPWSRGSALRIRADDVLDDPDRPAPADNTDRPPPVGSPSPLGPDPLWDAHDARWESFGPGTGVVWLRPHRPLVEGEVLTPTVRTALVADLVMTVGTLLPRERYVVVNPDLTLALTRPAGEWIRVESTVRLNRAGAGHSEGVLSDGAGWVGRVVKSLLVDRRS